VQFDGDKDAGIEEWPKYHKSKQPYSFEHYLQFSISFDSDRNFFFDQDKQEHFAIDQQFPEFHVDICRVDDHDDDHHQIYCEIPLHVLFKEHHMIDYRLLVLEAFNPPSDKQHVDYRNHYIEVLVDLIERNIVG